MTKINKIEIWEKGIEYFYYKATKGPIELPDELDLKNTNAMASRLIKEFEEEFRKKLDTEKNPITFLKETRKRFDLICTEYIEWYDKAQPSQWYCEAFRNRVLQTQSIIKVLSDNLYFEPAVDDENLTGAKYARKHYEDIKKLLPIEGKVAPAVRAHDSSLDNKQVAAIAKAIKRMLDEDGIEEPFRNINI